MAECISGGVWVGARIRMYMTVVVNKQRHGGIVADYWAVQWWEGSVEGGQCSGKIT